MVNTRVASLCFQNKHAYIWRWDLFSETLTVSYYKIVQNYRWLQRLFTEIPIICIYESEHGILVCFIYDMSAPYKHFMNTQTRLQPTNMAGMDPSLCHVHSHQTSYNAHLFHTVRNHSHALWRVFREKH